LAALLLAFGSLTEPLVRLATHLIASLGLGGVTLLTLSTGVIGLPGTEPTMLFAGFDVFQGNLTLPGIIVAGLIGDMAGASIAYAIGYYGRRELLERQGAKLHMSPRRLDRAHHWFERFGAPAIFVSRFIPVVRAAFPYAAGVAEMPFWRFFVLATLGSIVWITGLAVLGREVGSDWQTWRHHLEYVDYVGVTLVVVAIVYLIVRRTRPDRDDSGAPHALGVPEGEPADVVAD
jgi:membrane protein DedA with SNARE-associated domain